MERIGIWELFTGTIGAMADAIHRWTGAYLPWGVRLGLAILWDAFDIVIRVIAWPFALAVPGLMLIVRGILDYILTLFGVILWGSPGLLQSLELLGDMVPGFGWILDLTPMLTIGGLVARKREQQAAQEQKARPRRLPRAAERSLFMPGVELICAILGLLIGLLTWWLGVTTGGWVIGFTILGVIIGILIRVLEHVEIPRRVLGVAAIGVAILILIDLLAIGILSNSRLPEQYRRAAWEELVAEGDAEVKKAKEADETRATVRSVTEGVGGVLRGAGETIAGALKEKEFVSPLLEKGRKALIGALQPKEKKPKPTKKAKKGDVPEELKEELGPAQQELYRSKYVLDRAKRLAEGPIEPLQKGLYVLFAILGLIGLAAVVQTTQPQQPRVPTPSERDTDRAARLR